jgi:hypothetical protein
VTLATSITFLERMIEGKYVSQIHAVLRGWVNLYFFNYNEGKFLKEKFSLRRILVRWLLGSNECLTTFHPGVNRVIILKENTPFSALRG